MIELTKYKLFIPAFLVVALNLLVANTVIAQKAAGLDYTTGLGIRLDVGNGSTFAGPAVKHFFTPASAGEASILFGNRQTLIGLEYSYNGAIPGAAGLKWNVGIGPQLDLYTGGADVLLRPFAGLQFKIPQAPIDVGFDWRPAILLASDSDVEAGRFGLALRFTL